MQDIFNIMSSKLVFKAAPATFLIVVLSFKMVIYGEHIHMLIFFSCLMIFISTSKIKSRGRSVKLQSWMKRSSRLLVDSILFASFDVGKLKITECTEDSNLHY